MAKNLSCRGFELSSLIPNSLLYNLVYDPEQNSQTLQGKSKRINTENPCGLCRPHCQPRHFEIESE